MGRMTYAQAGALGLSEAMREDPRVWALGEDLGPEGGVGGQYKGLQQEFGPARIFDTPISENNIMGAGVGAALVGTRPVVELRYCDFALCAADEIVNQAAKIRYMTGGQTRAPLVVRQTIGIRTGAAAQHNQSIEAWWVHTPGLVVVAPATPADNRALLLAAIRCDDPVIYLEHKELWASEGDVPDAAGGAELGVAKIMRPGSDLTIVSWSRTALECVIVADKLAAEGVEAEVIDLRTLYPWDRETVFASIHRTGRLLVAHEASRIGGFGGEIVAEASERMFSAFKAPPMRVAGPRSTIPFSEPLETMCRVEAQKIEQAVRKLIAS